MAAIGDPRFPGLGRGLAPVTRERSEPGRCERHPATGITELRGHHCASPVARWISRDDVMHGGAPQPCGRCGYTDKQANWRVPAHVRALVLSSV